MDLWSLTPAAFEGELWRLWTGHIVHYDVGHLLVNLVAAAVPLALLPRRLRIRILLRALIIAPILSAVLLWIGGFDELRGLSGLAVFLWCSAGFTLAEEGRPGEGAALLGAVAVKLLLEQQTAAPLGGDRFQLSTAAHAAAALLAVTLSSSAAMWRSGIFSRAAASVHAGRVKG